MPIELDTTMIEALVASGVAVCAAVYAAYLKGMQKTNTTTPVQPTSPNVVPIEPVTPVVTHPKTDIFDSAEHGGKGPNNFTWEQMRGFVLFRVSEATKSNMLAGIVDPKDRERILEGIRQGEINNLYHYTIGYNHGYFIMDAVCDPIGTTQYKYQVMVSSSGSDKQ